MSDRTNLTEKGQCFARNSTPLPAISKATLVAVDIARRPLNIEVEDAENEFIHRA
jgi:hypothetical protein